MFEQRLLEVMLAITKSAGKAAIRAHLRLQSRNRAQAKRPSEVLSQKWPVYAAGDSPVRIYATVYAYPLPTIRNVPGPAQSEIGFLPNETEISKTFSPYSEA